MAPSIAELPWLPNLPTDFRARCRQLDAGKAQLGADIQFLAGYRLDALAATSLSKAIARCRSAGADLAPLSSFRLGILSSNTIDLLADVLPSAAARHGISLELAVGPYDQVMQQALDPGADIHRQRPNAVLVAVDHRWLQLHRPELDGGEEAVLNAAIGLLRTVIGKLREHGGTPAILQTIPVPPQWLFGSLDRRLRGSQRWMIEEANSYIVALCEETGSYLLDVAALAERIGTDRWFDPVQWNLYKLPCAADLFDIYADMLGRLIGAIRGKSRKCLVLDLDNTLWGGVIGDDGIDGIILGQGSAAGEAFLAIQKMALELRARGIMLAVSSKNEDETARGPFLNHTEMLLKLDHIAVFQANWIDKSSNLEAIAQQLNIGLDSLVLLDDNPAERAHVRAVVPMVAVPELPDDPSWFPWYLTAAGYFEAVNFSMEDKHRSEIYRAEAVRAAVMARAGRVEDYLEALKMVISFSPFNDSGRSRIVQLINKSNQFNLTTRRYTDAQLAELERDPKIYSLQVRLRDGFGDMGMIAVVICRPLPSDSTSWEVDTWLMSCRVLGRKVEEMMLAEIVEAARTRGITRIIGVYIRTSKNTMVSEHYQKLGFRALPGAADRGQRFELALDRYAKAELPFAVERLGAAQPRSAA